MSLKTIKSYFFKNQTILLTKIAQLKHDTQNHRTFIANSRGMRKIQAITYVGKFQNILDNKEFQSMSSIY